MLALRICQSVVINTRILRCNDTKKLNQTEINQSYLSRSIYIYSRFAAARPFLLFYFCFSSPEEFLYPFLFFSLLFFILRFHYGLVKLSTVETVHRTKTDHFLARSHMVSVNEQSSPILDVERRTSKKQEDAYRVSSNYV